MDIDCIPEEQYLFIVVPPVVIGRLERTAAFLPTLCP
jgi:hypothetical protein